MKYRRLLKMVLQIGLLCAVSGFVLRYLWDYGFSAEGMTQDILITRSLEALKKGMLIGGLYISFPVWLVLEKFHRPKRERKVSATLDQA